MWIYNYTTSNCLSTLGLTSTEKLVKCVVLHSTGRSGSLSCIIPSIDHPPMVWLLQNISTNYMKGSSLYVCTLTFHPLNQNPSIHRVCWSLHQLNIVSVYKKFYAMYVRKYNNVIKYKITGNVNFTLGNTCISLSMMVPYFLK